MIRFATIGTSAIVDRFLEAAALCEGLVHTAVFSRKKETAKAFAKKHGAEFIYTDLKELAESSDIDAVYIASPNSCHCEQAVEMLKHGKHVLCEKPAASNAAELQTIFSDAAQSIDSRFGNAEDFVTKAKEITGAEPMLTIPQAEPIGPKGLLDLLILMPCTGNSIAKLANGITDTPALMAAKAHLRNERPLLVSISTNDALGMNMKNIGLLLNTKHVYFVPFKQDNPQKKPNSMIASLEYLIPAAEAALEGRQYQPIIQ